MSERDEREFGFGQEAERLNGMEPKCVESSEVERMESSEAERECFREAFASVAPSEEAKARMWAAIAAADERALGEGDDTERVGRIEGASRETADSHKALRREDVTVYQPRKRRFVGVAVAACLVLVVGVGVFAATNLASSKGSHNLSAPAYEEAVLAEDAAEYDEAADYNMAQEAAEAEEPSAAKEAPVSDASVDSIATESAVGAGPIDSEANAGFKAALERGALVVSFEGEEYSLDGSGESDGSGQDAEAELGSYLGIGVLSCVDDATLGPIDVELYRHGDSVEGGEIIVRLPEGSYAFAKRQSR